MFCSKTIVCLMLSAQLCVTFASVIETDCVSDEFLSSAGNPTDEAGEILNAGERDFSVNLIKSIFKVNCGFISRPWSYSLALG
jgi:hypothetical protein